MNDEMDEDSLAKREAARERIMQFDMAALTENPKREEFFEKVYNDAENDPVSVPWADLAAKDRLSNWLSSVSRHSGKAIDVGCGLGDNAEAMSDAGYKTTAFDFSPKAIDWARQRFPNSEVDYRVADLFDLPGEWIGAFDLVHECYTLQSIPPVTLTQSVPAIARLVAPGGTLLVYSRVVDDGVETDGPPWPLQRSVLGRFERYGLKRLDCEEFDLVRPDRKIAHQFAVWRRPE